MDFCGDIHLQQNPLRMKLRIFLIGLVFLGACRTARETPPKTSDALHVTITEIHNAMPSGDDPPVVRKPYLIIHVCPQDNTLSENIRLKSMTVTGTDGTWTAATFDHGDYRGKGAMEYENVLRDFNPGVAPPYALMLTVEIESGIVKNIAVPHMKTWIVY